MAVQEGPTLTIVVDTNVIVAALIQRGIVRELLLGHRDVFVTPEACIGEVWENRGEWNRGRVPDDLVRETLDLMTEQFVAVVPRPTSGAREREARALIRDPDDVPVVALALSIDNEGIWTFNTKDFSSPELLARVRILGPGEVKALLAER